MATYYENVAALSPKVWFKFNETTGSPVNSGSATCTLTKVGFGTQLLIDQPGVIDRSVRFVGEKYYTFSQLTNVMQDKSFSIEFWHKLYATGGANQYLFTNVTGVSTNAVAIQYYGDAVGVPNRGKYTLEFRGGTSASGGTYYELTPANKSTEFEWHHIVATFSPTAVILYVDGTNVAQQLNPAFGTDTDFDSAQLRAIGGTTQAYMDELAIYPTTLTPQQVYDNYNSAFNSFNTATALTASALAVNPALSINSTATATPLTASAASGNHFNSTRDNFTLLNTYMGTLSLEQWYKFDDVKNIVNYGSGGAAAFYFTGNATSEDHSGIQGSGALRICGNDSDGAVYITLDDYTTMSPELTDGDFSVGFWVKAPSAVSNNPAVVWNA